jgi:molecular chaperone GrpE (heat shock protein)
MSKSLMDPGCTCGQWTRAGYVLGCRVHADTYREEPKPLTELEQAKTATEEWRKSAQHWEAELRKVEAECNRWQLRSDGWQAQFRKVEAEAALYRKRLGEYVEEEYLDNPAPNKVKPEDE